MVPTHIGARDSFSAELQPMGGDVDDHGADGLDSDEPAASVVVVVVVAAAAAAAAAAAVGPWTKMVLVTSPRSYSTQSHTLLFHILAIRFNMYSINSPCR